MHPLQMASTITFIIFSSILGFFLLRRHLIHRKVPPLPPGPKTWPIIGNLLQLGPKPHQRMAELARVHGPLMHLKMGLAHVVVASSANIAEQFLKVHDANFLSRPPSSMGKYISNYEGVVSRPYGQHWRWLRKISNVHFFSTKALDQSAHIRKKEVEILVRTMLDTPLAPIHVGQMVTTCVTNALARVLVGTRVVGYGCHNGGDEKSHEFKAMVIELMELSGIFNIGDHIPLLEGFDLQGVGHKMKEWRKKFYAFLSSIIEQHQSEGSDSDLHGCMTTFLSTLISFKDVTDGKGAMITDTEIKTLLVNMFAAGTDTTSSTVEWAIAELIRHPKIMAKAHNELNTIVGPNRLVTESDLTQLTYFQAIVKEVLRLHPPTPLSLPRIAEESCEIDGYFIPKGSTLLVNVWAIGRNPDTWSNPLEFRPKRFLVGGEKPNIDVRGNDFEVIPFGAGRRICPGVNLGMRMVQLLTANLIHAFDLELVNEQLPHTLSMEEKYGLTLQRMEPLVVHAKPKSPSLVYETQA